MLGDPQCLNPDDSTRVLERDATAQAFQDPSRRRRTWQGLGLQTLGLQIAQSRSYLDTSGPKVGIIYVLGALEKVKLRLLDWLA